MSNSYDVIIIGAGHNGLVAAAKLAKAGKKVLVFERRTVLGGVAATEELWPGFKVSTGLVDAGLFQDKIIEYLKLKRFGLEFIEPPANLVSLQKNGDHFVLWRNLEKSVAEIAKISKRDAERFPEFMKLISKFTRILNDIVFLTPPDVMNDSIPELLPWLRASLRLKRLGKSEMMEFLRILPMSAKQFLDEWFENETLKGALASRAIMGSKQGPQASGTTYMMLYHWLGSLNKGLLPNRFIRGGIGNLSTSLAKAAESYKAEIRIGTKVEKIITEKGIARGVVLSEGEEVFAGKILSNADPYQTLIELVGAQKLGPQFVRKVRNIRFHGTTVKLNLALDGIPQFIGMKSDTDYLGSHILLSPSLEYLERAYDNAKYGFYSHNPFLDIVIPSVLDRSLAPEGKHIMSVTMQYAPYDLRDSNWDDQREKLTDRIIEVISEYAPNIKEILLHKQIITPRDFETEYSLKEGSIYHGQMGLDQLLFMRPVPGFGQYRTPIENLYLCGSGTHPGGGITGVPGFNAAREVLKDIKR